MHKDNSIKTQIVVMEQTINVLKIDNSRYPIQNWMRNKDVIAYLELWETKNNDNFKGVEFDTFKNEMGSNK